MANKFPPFLFIKFSICFFGALLLLSPTALAAPQTFEKEYVYSASDADSKLSCRTISLEQAKRLLLEELGTYLESHTEVKNFRLTSDQITSLTAGVVKTEIVSEDWDGKTYKLKAKITADPDDVARAVGTLRNDRKKTQELENIRRKADDALKQVERLTKELATLKEKQNVNKMAQYNQAVKVLGAADWQQKAWRFVEENQLREAIAAFSRAIELDPDDNYAYNGRGTAYAVLGKHEEAIADFKRAGAWDNLAGEYLQIGKLDAAAQVLEKALGENSNNPFLHERLGEAFFLKGDYQKALGEYQIAEKRFHSGVIHEKIGHTYRKLGQCEAMEKSYREALRIGDHPDLPENLADIKIGLCYYETKRYKRAIAFYQKGLPPPANQYSYLAYYNLACIYGIQQNIDKVVFYLKTAINLHPECKKHARTDGDFAAVRQHPRFRQLID